MSWAAHDLEPYVFQKHLGRKVAFMPLLAGSYAPDILTKWFVYGVGFFGYEVKAQNPARFHRGWPGVGFTHSLVFGVLLSLLIYAIWRKPIIAYSFLIGQWAHALTDMGDTVGTMLFFPFTTHLFSIGAWAYAGELGRQVDAGAYFSGLGFVWDGVWVVWAMPELAGTDGGVLPPRGGGRRPVLPLGGEDAVRAVAAGHLPRRVLLRDLPLDRVDDLGALHRGRRELQWQTLRLQARPELGRPALGARAPRRRT